MCINIYLSIYLSIYITIYMYIAIIIINIFLLAGETNNADSVAQQSSATKDECEYSKCPEPGQNIKFKRNDDQKMLIKYQTGFIKLSASC